MINECQYESYVVRLPQLFNQTCPREEEEEEVEEVEEELPHLRYGKTDALVTGVQ